MDEPLERDDAAVTGMEMLRPWRNSFRGGRTLLWILPAAFVAVFFYIPLAAILRMGADAALRAGLGAFPPHSILNVVGFTFFQAVLSTLLTVAVGLPGAYVFARYEFPLKRLLRTLWIVPFILPTVVVAAGFESLLGPNGWFNLALRGAGLAAQPFPFLHSLGAILLAHVFYNTSIVLRLVGSAWERLDPNLTDAARVLGANPRRAFRRVTLPLLMPSLLAAAALVFLFDFTSFGVILILGGPAFSTLEVEIYIQALQAFNLPAASLLSLLQIATTLILVVISSRLSERAEAATLRVGFRAARKPGSAAERFSLAAVLSVLAALFFLPLVSPIASSVVRTEPARGERTAVQAGFTLAYYQELFVNRKQSAFFATPIETARNSLLVATATMLIALALGIPASMLLARPGWLDRLVEPFLLLPLGTSAVTLGLGMLLVFSRPPLALIRSPLLLPIAHSLIALPFVVRSLKPALAGIPARLREAAATLGASPLRIWREVDFPIAARAVLSAAAFAFAISLGEFGATTIIVRPEFPTMPVAIYNFLSQPGGLNYGQAMAMATLLMLLCAGTVTVIERTRESPERI
jgi:thiamine transport system permease protein